MDEPASVSGLLIFARALYLGSGLVLVNATVFGWLILAPAVATASGQAWLEHFRQRLHAVFFAAAAFQTVTSLLWFWAAVAGMSETSLRGALDPTTAATVLFQTRFGTVCVVRMGLFALLATLAWLYRGAHRLSQGASHAIEGCVSLATAALLASVAWTGHAGAAGGSAFPWTLIADSIHLLAGAIWPAGLLFFAWILSSSLSRQNPISLSDLIAIARRFSALSLAAVVILAATGLFDTFFLVHSLGSMVGTTYGRVLCLKISIFFIMLVIAAWNRFRLLPLLACAIDEPTPVSAIFIVGRLRRLVRLELGLAAGIVVIVAFLGMLPPA